MNDNLLVLYYRDIINFKEKDRLGKKEIFTLHGSSRRMMSISSQFSRKYTHIAKPSVILCLLPLNNKEAKKSSLLFRCDIICGIKSYKAYKIVFSLSVLLCIVFSLGIW